MIRLLIAEDQEIVRRGIKVLLTTQADLDIVGEAGNGQQVIDTMGVLETQGRLPDVILMDIQMPVMNGVTATKLITEQYPATKILILTTFEDHEFVSEAIKNGAKGYLLKDTPLEELTRVIRAVAGGYTQFGPGLLEKALTQPAQPKPAPGPAKRGLPPDLEALTEKEKEVLSLIAQGSSNKEIAAALYISEGTVRNHVTHILGRLNVRDRTQAALIATPFLAQLQQAGG